MRKIEIGKKYKHFKGTIYIVTDLVKDSETLEDAVVYRTLDGSKKWVRKLDMFSSLVDKDKYPDVKQKYRFEEVKEEL